MTAEHCWTLPSSVLDSHVTGTQIPWRFSPASSRSITVTSVSWPRTARGTCLSSCTARRAGSPQSSLFTLCILDLRESMGGHRLIRKADFHLGQHVTCLWRVGQQILHTVLVKSARYILHVYLLHVYLLHVYLLHVYLLQLYLLQLYLLQLYLLHVYILHVYILHVYILHVCTLHCIRNNCVRCICSTH